MWERGTQDWYALFGKSIRREAFSQGKIRNMQEYWMYFKCFKPKDWDKRSAEGRRRNCAALPKIKEADR